MNAESPQSGEWVHVGDVLIDTGRLAAHLLARSGWHEVGGSNPLGSTQRSCRYCVPSSISVAQARLNVARPRNILEL
jgi:hypothetical protein